MKLQKSKTDTEHTMNKRKKYIPPATDIVAVKLPVNIVGAIVSIVKDNDKVEDGDSWDAKEHIGSWEKIWSNDENSGERL